MLPNDGRVISNFICQALRDDELTIYGKGLQTRSFCYVDDLIEGLVKLMNSEINGPVNLGNPDEFKIIDVANLIKKKLSPSIEFIYKPLPEDDPLQRKPIIDKAKKLLNWEPKITLSDGIDKTISYFKNLN